MVSRMTPVVLIVDTNDDGAVDEMTVIIWLMSVSQDNSTYRAFLDDYQDTPVTSYVNTQMLPVCKRN